VEIKLNLVENGIFPIVRDINNNKVSNDTGWGFSGTLQGEGKWSGIPCLFIRTSGCNLRCIFSNSICDTAYSSFYPEKNITIIDDILKILDINNQDMRIKHIVISGGEPTIQVPAIIELCKELKKKGYIITIETNATIYNEEFSKYIDLISMSPKLKSSVPTSKGCFENKLNVKWIEKHDKSRRNIKVIQSFIDGAHANNNFFQLKFVVSNEEDILEIKNEWLQYLSNYTNLDIMLMPEGMTEEQLKLNNKIVAKLATQYGFRFCPRLHVDIFGGAKKGV
jgi:7-carboxy-7-deazaguanine synthase